MEHFLLHSPIKERAPKTVFENQGIVASIPKMSGDRAPPTRAMDEQNPTAEDRTQVGYNSAEYVYRIEKQEPTANLPTNARYFDAFNIAALQFCGISIIPQSFTSGMQPEKCLQSIAIIQDALKMKKHKQRLRLRPINFHSE